MAKGENVNLWVEHVRKFARDHNMTYGCALSHPDIKTGYTKGGRKPITGREAYASMPTMEVTRKAKVIVPDAIPPKIVKDGSSYQKKKMTEEAKAYLKARRTGGM